MRWESSKDQRKLVDVAVAVLEGQISPWSQICAELSRWLELDLVGHFAIDWPGGRMRQAVAGPEWASPANWEPSTAVAHPLVRHHAYRLDGVPRTTGEVPDDLNWFRSPKYAPLRDMFGSAQQHLLIPVADPGRQVRYVGGARAGSAFNEFERRYLRIVQPLLRAVDAHTRELSRLRGLAADDVSASPEAAAAAGLTPREETVLILIADGLTTSAIARRLSISPHTVVRHQQNLYRKLGVNDRLAAVLSAQRAGILGLSLQIRRSDA
jgi:DNA-binding CsgD family transcriptional regulator